MDEGFEAWLRLPGQDIMPGKKEWYASWSAWQASRRAAMEECRELREALVGALIPLEALNADNSLGAKWMCEPLKAEVEAAIIMGRAAIRKMAEEGGGG
jgi:hypothetical protein